MVSILNKILILIAALLIIFIAGILLLRKLSTARAKICYSIIGCLVLALVAAGLFIDLQREKSRLLNRLRKIYRTGEKKNAIWI